MKLSDNITINLPVLLESRLLVQANSGGGKSWTIRRLLEQTAPHVQQLIIDPEGEFATLREKGDYVIAAPHDGDAVASPKTAALLARRLLETGVSAILDIYDLKAHERQQFVKNFLHALINAPRALWHPVIVVVDEAHVFAPQNGSAEALPAVIDMATRGRKRGQCLVLATTRLSKLHKDCAAEMLNKLIGRTGLDVDVKRAADELGLTARDAMQQLRNLIPGEFFVFGPALSTTVVRTRIGAVQTTHPKAGQRLMQAPPKPSSRVLASLAKLADLQREAEHEAATVEDLTAQNAKLRRDATLANKRAERAGVPEAEVQNRIQTALREQVVKHADDFMNNSRNNLAPDSEKAMRRIVEHVIQIGVIAGNVLQAAPTSAIRASAPTQHLSSQGQVTGTLKSHCASSVTPSTGLSGPEQRIIDAIAWLESIGVAEPEQPAVAFLAGYTYGAGGFNNPKGRLNQTGLVEYQPGSRIRLTDAGRAVANAPNAPATTEELHDRVLAKLPGPEQRILRPLLDCYPKAMPKTDLAHAARYTPGAGGFNNPCGRLRSLGLIDYPAKGTCAARALLFPRLP